MKNILTTIFGILFALGDFFLWLGSRMGWIEKEIGLVEILVIAALAYLLIQAYNKTLQGFSRKMLGIKKDE